MRKFKIILIIALFTLFNVKEVSAISDFSQIGMIRMDVPVKNEINSCINDNGSHMKDVEKFVYKYYEGKSTLVPLDIADFTTNKNIQHFNQCDVINYSIGVIPIFIGHKNKASKLKDFKEEEAQNIQVFLNEYKGIVVSAAGNEEENTTFSSPIARYREWASINGMDTYEDRLFVIGQIERTSNGEYIHHYAHGDQIDFVVPNYNEGLLRYKKDFKGTSYAAPVVTALISQMLLVGVPKDEIRNVLGFEDELHYWKGKEYPVLSVMKTFRNTNKYLKENK